jgi:hypothetical protein
LIAITTPEGLAEWQGRLGIRDAEAARRLGIPYLSYREYLPGGRRRRGGLPGWMPVLCGFLEREATNQKTKETDMGHLEERYGADRQKLRGAAHPIAAFARALVRASGDDADVVATAREGEREVSLTRGDLRRLQEAYDTTGGTIECIG